MSFKCSVFGHRYGDPEVEREREEQGSEVVITITETETCKRCGEQRIVSENKEVTTLETPSDIVGDDLEDDESEDETAAESTPDRAGAGVTEAEPEQTPAAESTTPEPESPETDVTDDAEILDDGDDESGSESEHGTETEQVTDMEAEDPTAWPQEDDDTEEEDDAVILDADDDDDEGRAPGEWPEDDDDGGDDWAPDTSQDLRPVEDEQPDVEPTADAVTVPSGEFYCPECEFTTAVEASSLREGDFCPECHRGSLTHRPAED
jgi:ssDNA-binding Zn-finger/Zn-ribbon topoisomerase 1